jgi:hypothetical protein
MRFKIVDKAKAAEIGITEIIPNAEGIVMLDISQIPKGWSILDTIDRAVESGVLVVIQKESQEA